MTTETQPIPGMDQQPQEQPTPETTAPQGPRTYLRLSDERMRWLVDKAILRIQECRADMGVDLGSPNARPGSWAWDRQVARMAYYNNFDWRKAFGEIWNINNWSMGVPRRFVRLLAAKIEDDLCGSSPWFAAMPMKPQNADLSKQVERKVQEEADKSNLRMTLSESIRVALTEGERVVKVTHVFDATTYYSSDTVLHDQEGTPIITRTGEHIFPKDGFFENPMVKGEMRLKKDPTFVMPMDPQGNIKKDAAGRPLASYLTNPLIRKQLVRHDGLDASGLFCEDFIYPINVASLDDADIMAHSYDDVLEKVQRLYEKTGFDEEYGHLFPTKPLAQRSLPNAELGERNVAAATSLEKINIHEAYIRCDADEDGEDEWIFLVLDINARKPLYAEYLGVMNMKKPPFVMLRGLESVPGRAYGLGIYKLLEHENLYIDLCFNRIALKNAKEASVTFIHRDGTEETKAGLEMVLGDKKIYHIPANVSDTYNKNNPPIFRVNLAELDEFAIEHMERMIEACMLTVGISAADSGSAGQQIGGDTATAVRNIERTGNTLQRTTENMIADDINAIMDLAVDCVLENMDDQEVAMDPETGMLSTLDKEEIRTLDRDVRLLLTKARSAESIAVNTAAMAVVEGYYAKPPSMRKRTRMFCINLLKNYDVQDADDLLEEPTDEELQAEASAKAPPPKPLSATFNFKPEDLAQNQRDAVLGEFGLPAATAPSMAQAQQVADMTAPAGQPQSNIHALPTAQPESVRTAG